ncbi:MAG: peptidylprolyl isomerase [Rubrivivax sp.]
MITNPFRAPPPSFLLRPVAIALLAAVGAAAHGQQLAAGTTRNADWIAAVVNQESVTAGEVERRVQRARAEAERAGQAVPTEAELRQLALDALIDERAMITQARDSGMRVDDAEIDRAVQNIALQNQLTLEALRQRLAADGVEFARFRANLRDQIMMERLREREVYQRIRVSDDEIDQYLEQQRRALNADAETNIAQILVTVPEGASPELLAQRQARAQAALARVRAGADFEAVAREISEDGNSERGGVIGLRPASRLPDLFVEHTRSLKNGEVAPTLLRSGAGFHVLKLIERRDRALGEITQTRARHVLLRTSAQLDAQTASSRLAEYKRQIESGSVSFEEIARRVSEDSSAASGGDLGWSDPGQMVPEFESAMNALPPNGLSDPVVSRFGVHLIQVLERRTATLALRQLREQARNVLREQRFEQAYVDWTRELRSRAYVELREPPL